MNDASDQVAGQEKTSPYSAVSTILLQGGILQVNNNRIINRIHITKRKDQHPDQPSEKYHRICCHGMGGSPLNPNTFVNPKFTQQFSKKLVKLVENPHRPKGR